MSSRVSSPQAKPKIFDSSPKNFLPRHLKNWVPPPQPPEKVNFAACGRLGVTINYGVHHVLYMPLNVNKLRLMFWSVLKTTWKLIKSISVTIFLQKARRRRKIFQIVCTKINFGSKIRVPPPGKMKNFSFLPKTYFSPGIFKTEFPPRQDL